MHNCITLLRFDISIEIAENCIEMIALEYLENVKILLDTGVRIS
jgi:hypothetical protein